MFLSSDAYFIIIDATETNTAGGLLPYLCMGGSGLEWGWGPLRSPLGRGDPAVRSELTVADNVGTLAVALGEG